MVSDWIRTLVRWISYYIGGTDPTRASFPAFQERFPGITEEVYRIAWEESQRGIAAVNRLYTLDPTAPLSGALGGEEPPAERVEVRALVRWAGGDAPARDRLITVEARWEQSAADVYALVQRHAREVGENYEAAVTSITIIAPLRYPR